MKAFLAAAALTTALTQAASATTITFTDFTSGAFGDATDGLSNVVTEDFELVGARGGAREITPGTVLSTDVGDFSSLGGQGSGGTVSRMAGNTGQNVAIREGNVYGRQDIVGGRYFIDSNDTFGIAWDVRSSAGAFNSVVFAVTDASEFSYLRIIADGVAAEQTNGQRLRNGHTSLVEIRFDTLVTEARIELAGYSSYRGQRVRNDGFSLDGAAVGVAPVPLPASLPLLAFGVAGFWAVRRKAQS